MIIASQKRKENIAEYLLYMWQIEDIIRAYKLDIDTIDEQIVSKYNVPDDKMLVSLYSVASCDDKRVLWTLLERYGGNHGTTKRQ